MGYFEDQEKLSEQMSNPAAVMPQPYAPQNPAMGYPVQEHPVQEHPIQELTFDELCKRYSENGMKGKMFIVSTNLSQDDDMDKTLEFLFAEPKAASYDRYVKTASVSSSKAMRTFVLDNICKEQRGKLEKLLNDYPAMGISLGEKLLYMLGLSKTTTVRRL